VVALQVKKAVIFCGMPGSGKSIGATVAKELKIPVCVMGDVVREEVTHQQLPHSPQSLGKVMLELREQFGDAIIAERCIDKIQQFSSPHVVIDGARSEPELRAFQQAFDCVIIVAVHASPKIRFQRLQKRGRADDAFTKEVFNERDARELDIGLGRIFTQADVMLVNEGNLEELKAHVRVIFKDVFNFD
jgi:dephospho-CoA kinase